MPPDTHDVLNQFIEPGDTVSLLLSSGLEVTTTVRQLAMNRLGVVLPPELDPNEHFPLESRLKIAFPNMPPIDHVIVTNVQLDDEPLLWMKLPEDTHEYFYQRREHVRVAIRFPVTVQATDPEGKIVSYPGECLNISGGGMKFVSSAPLEVDALFQLVFSPPPGPEVFNLSCAVVSSKPSPYRTSVDSFKSVIAARYLQILPGQKDRLIGMCFRYELQQKKHLR